MPGNISFFSIYANSAVVLKLSVYGCNEKISNQNFNENRKRKNILKVDLQLYFYICYEYNICAIENKFVIKVNN